MPTVTINNPNRPNKEGKSGGGSSSGNYPTGRDVGGGGYGGSSSGGGSSESKSNESSYGLHNLKELPRIASETTFAATCHGSIAVNSIIDHAITRNSLGYGPDALASLTTLNLSHNYLSDGHAKILSDGLYGYTLNLQVFNFCNNTIGPLGLDFLVKGSIGIDHLQKGGSDIHNMMQGVLTLPTTSIVCLNLANNKLGDVGAADILSHALASGKLPATKQIDVSGNNITDVGKGCLAKAIDRASQKITVALETIQNVSKETFKLAIKGMIEVAKLNGINPKEALTTQETVEYCKKGSWNVGKKITYGIVKCITPADTPIALYEMDLHSLVVGTATNVLNPLKKPAQFVCLTQETFFSVVDEDFTNCLSGLDSGLNE